MKRSISVVFAIVFNLVALTPAWGQRGLPAERLGVQANTVAIAIEGFPVVLDVFNPAAPASRAAFRALGIARVEGSAVFIDLAPGQSLPQGGLVVNAETTMTPALLSALGLPTTARLHRGVYSGTVYLPEEPMPPTPSNARVFSQVPRGTIYRPIPTFPEPLMAKTKPTVQLNLGGGIGPSGPSANVGLVITWGK